MSILNKIWCVLLLSAFLWLPDWCGAVSITPLRQTAVLEAGEKKIFSLDVVNDEKGVLIFQPEVDAFDIDEKTGMAIFGKEDPAIEWISAKPAFITLAPGETGRFLFTVSVPENAEVVSHYLGFFATQKGGEGNVSVNSRLGSLFFLHIAGEIKELLSFDDFASDNLFFLDPLRVEFTLKNLGNIHVIPSGDVILRSWWGGEITRLPLNEGARKILPDGVWSGSFDFNSGFLKWYGGPVFLEINGAYGMSEKKLVLEKTIWYFPLFFVLVVFSLLAFFIVLIIWKKKRQR